MTTSISTSCLKTDVNACTLDCSLIPTDLIRILEWRGAFQQASAAHPSRISRHYNIPTRSNLSDIHRPRLS